MAPSYVVDGKLQPSGTVGFYGCQVADRLVRVAAADGLAKGPRVVDVDPCPACGNRHTRIKPHWRQPTPRDEGRQPDLILGPEHLPSTEPSPNPQRKGAPA